MIFNNKIVLSHANFDLKYIAGQVFDKSTYNIKLKQKQQYSDNKR